MAAQRQNLDRFLKLNWIPLLLSVGVWSSAQAYEVLETGIPARREVYWINNEQVLFPGYDPHRFDSERGNPHPQSVLYIWNWSNRQAKVYADIPETDYVCYTDGFISFAIRKDGKRYIKEGKLGAEVEREWI